MSERWGFDLSMEAVRLMRREGGHWREVASEPIDGTDIEDRLQALADRIEPRVPVDVFLPRDQILYTEVEISSDEAASAEIDAAMEGRTPYTLEELEIDWEPTGDGTARVAAIARETLDEAETFARSLGLDVLGFSALADAEDFPRLPDFGGGRVDFLASADAADDPGEAASEEDEEDAGPAPGFVSARTKSAAPLSAPAAEPDRRAAEDGPVVLVDDPTPVLRVPAAEIAPLDPGPPLPRVTSEPRISTDRGAHAALGRAASLAPASVVRTKKRDRALPTPALAAVAAILSIGIAIIIWSILPSVPDTSRAPLDGGPAVATAPAPEEDVAASAPEPLPELSDTPPEAQAETAALSAPAPGTAADPATTAPMPVDRQAAPASPAAPAVPPNGAAGALALRLDPRPETLAGVDRAAPAGIAQAGIPMTGTADDIVLPVLAPVTHGTDPVLLPAAPERDSDLVDLDTSPPDPLPEPDTEPLAAAGEATVPAEAAPAPEEDVAAEVAATPPLDQVAADAPPATEPALVLSDLARSIPASVRPPPRPGNVAEIAERQRFGGRSLAQLARIRPPKRPEGLQLPPPPPVAGAPTELAVATSLRPRSRPGGWAEIVARAEAREQERLAARTPDTTAAIEAALAEDLEEEAAAAATDARNSPRLAIPSDASVARRATVEDAIQLNRINLVGVYGLPSDRRALVRLASGKYVKVKVGDKIDGGTVASISDSELRYIKGGKTVSLRVPSG